jgi:hypothetical protein
MEEQTSLIGLEIIEGHHQLELVLLLIIHWEHKMVSLIKQRNKESLKNAQNDKIENVAGSV